MEGLHWRGGPPPFRFPNAPTLVRLVEGGIEPLQAASLAMLLSRLTDHGAIFCRQKPYLANHKLLVFKMLVEDHAHVDDALWTVT